MIPKVCMCRLAASYNPKLILYINNESALNAACNTTELASFLTFFRFNYKNHFCENRLEKRDEIYKKSFSNQVPSFSMSHENEATFLPFLCERISRNKHELHNVLILSINHWEKFMKTFSHLRLKRWKTGENENKVF